MVLNGLLPFFASPRRVYVMLVLGTPRRMQLYRMSEINGVLTAVGTPQPAVTNQSGYGMAVLNGAIYLLVISSTNMVRLYRVNETTGVLTAVGPQQSVPFIDESGSLGLGVRDGSLYAAIPEGGPRAAIYRVDDSDGALTPIGSPPVIMLWSGQVGSATLDDVLYVMLDPAADRVRLYVGDITTGLLNAVGPEQTVDDLDTEKGIGMAGNRGRLYAGLITDSPSDQLRFYTVSTTTGTLTALGPPQAATALDRFSGLSMATL